MEDLEDIEPSDPSFLVGDADKGQWQKSWRRDTGCKSKGRVKGLSNLFDREASEQDEHSTPNSVFRTRTVSDASVSSIESISDTETTYDIDWKALSAIELESSDVSFDSNATLSPSCFTDSGISATASKIYSDWSPPRITHPVSEPPEVHLSLPDSEKQYTTLTAKPESANRDLKLHDIFACADAASTGMTSIPSRNGSMILVKKSQLAEYVIFPVRLFSRRKLDVWVDWRSVWSKWRRWCRNYKLKTSRRQLCLFGVLASAKRSKG